MKWHIPRLRRKWIVDRGSVSKEEIGMGIHGIPWGISDADAPKIFSRRFGTTFEYRCDTSLPNGCFCEREIGLRGGRMYGMDMDIWWLKFGSKRPGQAFQLYWLTVLRNDESGLFVDELLGCLKDAITRRYGPHDRNPGSSIFCWDWSNPNGMVTTHNCMVGYPGNHVRIHFLNLQMDTSFRGVPTGTRPKVDALTRVMPRSAGRLA